MQNSYSTQAYRLHKKGKAHDAFRLDEISLPALKENQVFIEVESFGLNYADVMARNGLYREAPPMPCVIGYEVVGVVKEVHSSVDQTFVGKRVLAMVRFGGYARHAITNVSGIVEIGDLSGTECLALGTQWVTAIYMVDRMANVQEDENVLIHAAAGGVGTALIQLCKMKGATVFAKIGNEEKADLVKELGADFIVNYRRSDYIGQLRTFLKSERMDVSFNPVAGSTFKKDFHLIGSGGRIVLFGGSELSGGKWGIFSALNFIRKMGRPLPIGYMMRSKSVLGVNMLKISDFKPKVIQESLKKLIEMKRKNEIRVIIGKEFDHANLAQAHDLLESGKSTGKIVIHW